MVKTPTRRDNAYAGCLGSYDIADLVANIYRVFCLHAIAPKDTAYSTFFAKETGIAIYICKVLVQVVLLKRALDIAVVVAADNHKLVTLGMQLIDNSSHAFEYWHVVDCFAHGSPSNYKEDWQIPVRTTKMQRHLLHGHTAQLFPFLVREWVAASNVPFQKTSDIVKAVGNGTIKIKNNCCHVFPPIIPETIAVAARKAYTKNMEQQATLGGGCYWCLEAIYQRLHGVLDVNSGYSGGHFDNPHAEDVYSGTTGHAEVVQITFDSKIITYKELLEVFFVMHDPTTLNRQGNDVGDWYRSVIFYHDEKQKEIAENMRGTFASKLWADPIVTQIEPLEKFWPAGEEAKDYYNRNPYAGYCQVIIDPKIQKLRQKFATKLKPSA